MTQLSDKDHNTQMEDMRKYDEEMPSVGLFWYDLKENQFFGVCKQQVTPKMVEEAADNGLPFINFPHLHRQIWAKEFFHAQATGEPSKFSGDYTQVPRGRSFNAVIRNTNYAPQRPVTPHITKFTDV